MAASTGTGWAQLRQQARSLETQVWTDSTQRSPEDCISEHKSNMLTPIIYRLKACSTPTRNMRR